MNFFIITFIEAFLFYTFLLNDIEKAIRKVLLNFLRGTFFSHSIKPVLA